MAKNRQKRRRGRRKNGLHGNRGSVLCVVGVIVLLMVVISISSMSLKAKNEAYIAQETELEEQIQLQKDRAEEIDELEAYVGTDEYIEQTAKDKLGLVHENEIIFKRK